MGFQNLTFDCGQFAGNCTDEELALIIYRRHMTWNIVGCVVTILIAFISILGNLAVVLASFFSESLRVQTGNILIVNLSCTDILAGFFVMFPSAVTVALDYWPFDKAYCIIHGVLNYSLSCSSSVNLAVISFDRAIAVMFPFKYNVLMTKKVMFFLCFVIFFVGTMVGLNCAAPKWTSYNYSEGVCTMDYSARTYYVFTTSCFFCYYIPCTIIGICNTLIIVAANRSSKTKKTLFVRRDNINNDLKEKTQKDSDMKKTIKSMIVVIITYYICFSPYALSKQVKIIVQKDMPPWFNYLSTVFVFIASATNPFIYAILRKDYRDAFKHLPRMIRDHIFS